MISATHSSSELHPSVDVGVPLGVPSVPVVPGVPVGSPLVLALLEPPDPKEATFEVSSPAQPTERTMNAQALVRRKTVWLNTRRMPNTPGDEFRCRDRSDVSLMSGVYPAA